MAYENAPVNRADKDGAGQPRNYPSNDTDIGKAGEAGQYQTRTDVYAEGVGYLGVDNLDRIRRENLRHKTR